LLHLRRRRARPGLDIPFFPECPPALGKARSPAMSSFRALVGAARARGGMGRLPRLGGSRCLSHPEGFRCARCNRHGNGELIALRGRFLGIDFIFRTVHNRAGCGRTMHAVRSKATATRRGRRDRRSRLARPSPTSRRGVVPRPGWSRMVLDVRDEVPDHLDDFERCCGAARWRPRRPCFRATASS